MYAYLDFHTDPDDRRVRVVYQMGREVWGWVNLYEVGNQREGASPVHTLTPQLVKGRYSGHGDERTYRIPGGLFGNPGWWLDLEVSENIPWFSDRL